MGFFDIAQRYAGLDAKNDPLARIDEVVPWATFRPQLEIVWRRVPKEQKSPAGRKPWDAVVMFKAIVLCELYNLSDDQVEYQLRDRLSFMRFLGLGLEDKVPDAKTVWLYREQLAQAGVIEALFEDFDGYLEQQGYLAMGGQIIDASIVPVPKQRNSRDDNARIKEGETPEGWENQPAKRSQKDMDARWTKKHGKSHYGYVLLPGRAPWLQDFQTEILQFPAGKHDDQVDSLSQFLNWVSRPRRYGPQIRSL
jgi:transposase